MAVCQDMDHGALMSSSRKSNPDPVARLKMQLSNVAFSLDGLPNLDVANSLTVLTLFSAL
jgi:hypothetical protein